MAEDRKNAENYLRKGKFAYDTKVVTFGSFEDEDGEERPLEWNVLHVSADIICSCARISSPIGRSTIRKISPRGKGVPCGNG